MQLLKLSKLMLAGIIVSASLPAMTAMAEEAGDSPFKAKEKAPPPKPKTRSWTTIETGESKFSFLFDFEPGIADTDKLVEVYITVNELPERAHVTFGKRVPQKSAKLVAELFDASGKSVGLYRVHGIPLSRGKYGVHMTPSSDGIHVIELRGTSDEGKKLSTKVKMPVNVWPLPKELEGSGAAPASNRRRPIKL